MSTQPIFIIKNHTTLSLEQVIKELKIKYDKDISNMAFLDSDITDSVYCRKVDEIKVMVKNFNSDLIYYLTDFKNRLKYIDFDITFLISFLFETTCKEMSSIENSSYNSMIPYIKD